MFRRRTVRDDDRDVVYDDERRRPVADREIVDDRAPSRSERYVRDDAPPTEYADDRDVVRAPRREYVEDDVVRPSSAEYVEEHGDTYLASLPARVNMVL